MKLLFLIGSAAVGKMTVGQELTKITDLKLFHEDLFTTPVLEVFGSFNKKAAACIREIIFEEFAASDNYGLIFTYMWDFESPVSWGYIEHIKDIFLPYHTEFYYVELVAPTKIRLQRNATENRLRCKAHMGNIARSTEQLLLDDCQHRYTSKERELPFDNYVKIDNSNLPPAEAAQKIKEIFQL